MTKKITLGAFFLALSIVVPQIFHWSGIPKAGNVFLPMHIPVLISGFVLGPLLGMLIGPLSVLTSSILTGMPSMSRLPFMAIELACYGLLTGLFYHTLGLRHNKLGALYSLLPAMIGGRCVYAFCLFLSVSLLAMNAAGPAAAITATITGIPGIVLQLVLIPPIVFTLKKGGWIDESH